MRAEEKCRMAAELEESRAVLVSALRGATEKHAIRHPAPGRWSVLDCVEHLAIAEQYLLSQIEQGSQGEPAINENREARIRQYGADRSRPLQAPDGATPAGRYHSLADAMDAFHAARSRTIGFVESCEEDLRARVVAHPVLGTINAWEMLLTIVVHPHRHAGQIREILAD